MDRSTAGEAWAALRFIVGQQGLIIQALITQGMEVEALAMEILHLKAMAVVQQGAVIRTSTRTLITVTEEVAAWTLEEALEVDLDMATELEDLVLESSRATGTWVLLHNFRRA